MGFRQGSYMTVWSAEPSKSGNTMRVRLSSSRKNKQTDEYEQDFSGFCTFIGEAATMAKKLKEKDRIKVLSCDVSTTYNKEQRKEYVNYKVFEFEMADGSKPTADAAKPKVKANPFEEEGNNDEDDLPF